MSDVGMEPQNELSVKYDIQFESGFDFKSDGKLPGMFGGEPSCKSGGAQS